MQYVIKKVTTETFAVDAEDAVEAKSKLAEGKSISHDERITVEPRSVTSGGTTKPIVSHHVGEPKPEKT